MILDSSAVIAVLRNETDATPYKRLIADVGQLKISTATVLECELVLGVTRHIDLDELISRSQIEIVAFDTAQLRAAIHAHRQYGKGSGSKARLNFGDCFSYALAKTLDEPLLFKGDDFTHTDVTPALTPSEIPR